MEGLILRFDAPLMSFGGVKVDQHNITDRFPGLSLFAGLIANALGWFHGDGHKIQQIQDRLILASRWDIQPEQVVDYHTVDLGQTKMKERGWTTRGNPEHREGGSAAKFGTHIRHRHYLANGILTSVISMQGGEQPDLLQLETALKRPARPLFIGRKTCLPSTPILIGHLSGENVLTMLESVPRIGRKGVTDNGPMPARWSGDLSLGNTEQIKQIYDQRNWFTQLHEGSRFVVEGFIKEVP
jgi:CRISPR system Cascade subunit CasD